MRTSPWFLAAALTLNLLPKHAVADDEGSGLNGCTVMNGISGFTRVAKAVVKIQNQAGVTCGLYSQAEADNNTRLGFYAVYALKTGPASPIGQFFVNGNVDLSNESGTFSPSITSSSNPMCSQIRLYAWCPRECYTPKQNMLFGEVNMSLEQAYRTEARSVTAMTEDATLDNLSYAEQMIEQITTNDVDEEVYRLEGEGGERLEVTGNHPMVTADGTMMAARDLKAGDVLLDRYGAIVFLRAVSTRKYQGPVFNVLPVSKRKKENVLVAEGLLTGSMRYQQQWAHEAFRLTLRSSLDVSAL